MARDPHRVEARPALWRITDRRSFDRLRRHGARGRARAASVIWVPPTAGAPPAPARAAFAVARRSGGAVVRNRVRRRLRAGLVELARRGALPAGDYLVTADATAATTDWLTLVGGLDEAVTAATRGAR